MKIIIDTDPGIDDAVALGLVLKRTDLDIVGITTVRGNVDVVQSTKNVLKILQEFDRKDIPVFQGAHSPILDSPHYATHFHGDDGLGDYLNYEPDCTPLKTEHAVDAINRLANLYKNELVLIALGPLTNIALAYRLNDSLPSLLKELVIMGGNYKGVGNISMAAEFNFYIDPVAAHIVIKEFSCTKMLVTWEFTKTVPLSKEETKTLVGQDNKVSRFYKTILEKHSNVEEMVLCDALAVAVAVDPKLITKYHSVYAVVELYGEYTKGQMVIDWYPDKRSDGKTINNPNVIIVDQVNVELYKKMLLNCLQ
ncbi:uncharacterized protein LOC100197535 [Hydra vulgaris]|uniref:uncharacterized protein LOC100197535 n=1 Tax=Hydra vulgaris TaxID=6087 RepID=UPI0002B49BBA|nr:uncharacterized protein C1683.06c [Hydra vulgaris]